MCVEKVFHRIVIRRRSDYHKIRILISRRTVKRCSQSQRLLRKKLLDVLVLDWRDALVDFLNLFRYYVNGCHVVVLREECRHRETDVASAGDGDINGFHIRCFLNVNYRLAAAFLNKNYRELLINYRKLFQIFSVIVHKPILNGFFKSPFELEAACFHLLAEDVRVS